MSLNIKTEINKCVLLNMFENVFKDTAIDKANVVDKSTLIADKITFNLNVKTNCHRTATLNFNDRM